MQTTGVTRISLGFTSSLLLTWARSLVDHIYPETTGVQVKLHDTLNNLLSSFVLHKC